MSEKNWIAIARLDVNILDGNADNHIPIEVELSLRLTSEGELELVWVGVDKTDDSVDYYDEVYVWLDGTQIRESTND